MISFLCFNDAGPGSEALVRAVNEQLGPTLPQPATPSGTGGLQATMPGGIVSLMAMPAPFPADELTDDLGQRQAWPNWRTDSRAWRSHIIAAALGSGDSFATRRERAVSLLQVVAIAAACGRASAVGWSPNMLFQPAESFLAQAARAPLPVECVVRCLWRGQPKPAGQGMGLTTFGLGAFGLPEIDHPPTGEDPTAIYNRMMNLCSYVLAQGVVLGDGDTIGIDARASMRVQHTRSAKGEPLLLLSPATTYDPA